MSTGKVSEITYKRSVLKHLTLKTEGTCAGIDAAPILLEDVTFVMSSNCILKWFHECEAYYIQKTMNCVYEKGGVPKYVQLEINVPENFEEKLLGKIIKRFSEAAEKRDLVICQCRVYAGQVEKTVAHVTVVGTAKCNLTKNNIAPGMDVVMAGSVAVGGTAILAEKYKDKLSEKFTNSFVADCIKLMDFISVEKIAKTAIEYGAVSMHNISDGGTFGAIWELASSAELGITVNIPDIPVWQQVIEVAEVLDINPYLLEGTGSMLVVCRKGSEMVEKLNEEGIIAGVIGTITDSNDRIALHGDETRYLEPPRGDELYKFI